MAGKNRASAVSAILQNPTLLEDIYNDSAYEATGVAERNLEVTMSSIEKKMQRVQNLWQSLWQTDGIIAVQKLFYDVLYVVLRIVKHFGTLPTVIGVSLVSVRSLYNHSEKVKSVVSGISSQYKQLVDIGNTLNVANSLKIGQDLLSPDKINALTTATEGLNNANSILALKTAGLNEVQMIQMLNAKGMEASQIAATMASNGYATSLSFVTATQQAETIASGALTQELWNEASAKLGLISTENGLLVSKQALTYESAKQALAEAGIVGEQQALILSTLGLSAANTTATGTTSLFAGALTALKGVMTVLSKHPFMLAFTALSVGFTVVTALVNRANKSYSKQVEKLNETANEYKKLTDEVTNLENELKSVADRIDELNSKDTLSIMEENELSNLKLTSQELQTQLNLKKALAEVAARETADEAIETLNKKSEDGKDSFLGFGKVTKLDKAKELQNSILAKDIAMAESKRIVEDYEREYAGTDVDYTQLPKFKIAYDELQKHKEEQEEYKNEYLKIIGDLQEKLPNLLDTNGNAYDDTQEYVDEIKGLVGFADRRFAAPMIAEQTISQKRTSLKNNLIDKGMVEDEVNEFVDSLSDEDVTVVLESEIKIDENTTIDNIKEALLKGQDELDNTELTVKLSSLLSDDDNEKIDDYQSKLSGLQSYLEMLNDGSFTDSDLLDLAQEYDIVGDSVDELKNGINDLMQSEMNGILDKIDLKIKASVDPKEVKLLQNLKDKITSIYSEASKPVKIGVNVDAITGLENIEGGMSALDNALASLTSKEHISNFSEIKEAFGDLDGIEDFISTVSDAKGVTEETKKAFNDLASEYVTHSGILTKVTESNQNLIKVQLKEMGVANADALVQNQLAAEKEYVAIANKNLSDSTVEEISLIMKEGEVTETTRQYLGAYLTAKINANDIWAVSEGEISALLNMANSAGIAASALEGLYRAKCLVSALESGNKDKVAQSLSNIGQNGLASLYQSGSLSAGQLNNLESQLLDNYSNYLKNYIKNNSETISEEIKAIYNSNKVNVNYTGGKNTLNALKQKDKKSKSTKDFEQTIDYTIQSIGILEDKISRLDKKLQTAKGWKAQRKILDEMLKSQEKLTEGYKKQKSVYIGEYKKSMKELSKYVNADTLDKVKTKITSGEYFKIDKFVEKNISSDIDQSITEKIYNAIKEGMDWYNNALTSGQNVLDSMNKEIEDRKKKHQTFVDEASEKISRLDSISNNTSNAKKKNELEEQKLEWIKQQYNYQEKIYLLEGNMTKVSQNRAEKESAILEIRQKQLENINEQLESEKSLIELRANNIRDWGDKLATKSKNNKNDKLIDNVISSMNTSIKDVDTAKNKVDKSKKNIKAELKNAKGLSKDDVQKIKQKIKNKERIGDTLLNAVQKSGNKKLYNYLNNYNTNIDYLEIAKANKKTALEEGKSEIYDIVQDKIENISNKYDNKRDKVSTKTSLLDAQLEMATSAKDKNAIIGKLINQANKELDSYRDELSEANSLFKSSGKKVLSAKNLSKAFSPQDIAQIQTCVSNGKVIPNSLLNKASEYPALYKKLVEYNSYKVMVDNATTAYNQAEIDNANKVLDYKLTQNTNISDEKKALSELYKQLQANSTKYKEQNDYEEKSLKALKKSYEALLANALLENDITEYKRLQAEYQQVASQSALQQLENLEKYYSNRTSVNSNKASLIKGEMDIAEAKGYQLTSEYYNKLINLNSAEKERLETKKQQLQASFDESVATNKIVVGSDDWYSALEKIYAVEKDIQDCTKTELDYLNKINELNWANFDSLMKKISGITSESEFLLSLLSNDQLFDTAGNITSSGNAVMGLHAQNYNVYMAQADEYAKKIAEVQAQLANDPYNTKLSDKLKEYVEAQRDAIKSAESEKQAIIDLVKEGYDAQFSAIEKLIDKQKSLLQAEKDRYNYQKNIANQEKNILKLQKQIEALSNSTDRADIAKRLQLEKELADAMQDLEDTQYEHSVDTQEKAMDDALESYKEQIENYLKNTEKVLEDALKNVNNNTSDVLNSIQDKAQGVGVTISDNFISIWNNAGDAVTKYTEDFSSAITGITGAIESIKKAWEEALSAYKEYADKTISSSVNDFKNFGSATNNGSLTIEANDSSTNTGTNNGSSSSGTNSSTTTTSKKDSILKIIGTSSASNAESNNGTSALNKYMKSIGFGQLSFQEMSDLYNIFTGKKTTKDDFIGNSDIKKELLSYFQSWLKNNRDIVNSKFISNIGFADGGIGKLVKMSGEDGLAFVRNGEGFVRPEDVDSIQQLLKAVPLMNNLTDMIATKPIIPEMNGTTSNVSITAPLVNINGNLDNVTLDQLNRAIADVPKMLVKQMNKYGTR